MLQRKFSSSISPHHLSWCVLYVFTAAACIKTPLECCWGCQRWSLSGTLPTLELAVCRLLHCSGASGSARAGKPCTQSLGAQMLSQTHRNVLWWVSSMCSWVCRLRTNVLSCRGWQIKPCLLSRTCWAAKSGPVIWFGREAALPTAWAEWGASLSPSSTPCLPFAACRSQRDALIKKHIAVPMQWVGNFWGLCTHGGKQGAEQNAAHPPEQCVRLGTAWWSSCKRLGAVGWGLQGRNQLVWWACGQWVAELFTLHHSTRVRQGLVARQLSWCQKQQPSTSHQPAPSCLPLPTCHCLQSPA